MKENIKAILKDLYELDPELKKQEKKLIKIIEQFQKNKPNVEIDKDFIQELQFKLQQRADEHQPNLTFNFINMINKFLFPFAGGITATLLIMAVINYSGPNNISDDSKIDFRPQRITQLKDGAFERLPQVEGGVSPESLSRLTDSRAATGIGAGGGGVANEAAIEPAVNPAVSSDMRIMPYNPKVYEYNYTGEAVDLSNNQVTVYRRSSEPINTSELVNSIEKFGFNLTNVGKFKNLNVASIQLVQDQQYGYRININFNENTINIYQDWQKWPNIYRECNNDQQCVKNARLKESDIPNDSELINIANDFLNQYSIEKDNYAEPVIMKYWEREISVMRDEGLPESEVYIPENVNVIYPNQIDGKIVYDQQGNPMGLNVSVNIRYNRVASVNNLQLEKYESSNYAAITDWNTVDQYLKSGAGAYPYKEAEKIGVNLSNAEVVLMSLWHYDENSDRGTQYFTPALKFKIDQSSAENIYRENILVPLAKELFEKNQPNYSVEPIPFDSAPVPEPRIAE